MTNKYEIYNEQEKCLKASSDLLEYMKQSDQELKVWTAACIGFSAGAVFEALLFCLLRLW